jgi:hypothetical protein
MDNLTRQRLTSGGLVLAIFSSLIAMTAAGRPLVSGPGRIAGRTLVIDLPANTIGVYVIAAVVLLAMLLLHPLWAKLVGAATAFGLAGTEAFMVTIAKTSTRFHPGAATHLESGGKILGVAFIVGIAGVILMIVGARELMPDPDRLTADLDAAGLPVRPGSAMVALGFSALGVIFFPAAPVGVILGLIAYMQITQARELVPGRNVALSAIILGTTWISLWVILVFGTGIWSAHPV